MTARSWGILPLVVLTTTVLAACGVPGPAREGAPGVGFAEGWTELPLPPEVRDGAALAWTGRELLAWGGCDPARDCYPTDDGFAFDPSTRRWSAIPSAPGAGIDPEVVWTGDEALFFYAEGWKLKGVAYDPETQSWRTLPNAPLQPRFGAVHVWTGSEVVVWGGGRPNDRLAATGAAYDPVSDAWRPIADAPLGLNHASGVWTGREVLVFGSLLDNSNRATTGMSVGAAYDPASDAWRELPPSNLSPQATSAVWVGDRLLAWDYEVHAQTYDPSGDAWTTPERMPMRFSECYPETQVVDGFAFAFFCGQAALYERETSTWTSVRGGPLAEEVWSDAYRDHIKLWRFADLVAGDGVVYVPAEGITLSERGEACYGCRGSPHSFWAYRPEA